MKNESSYVVVPNSLQSVLVDVINRHNDNHEYQVTLDCFHIINDGIFIRGEYKKEIAQGIVRAWGLKFSELTNKMFSVFTLYFGIKKSIYYKETFNYGKKQ
jgi:hypothetical protein